MSIQLQSSQPCMARINLPLPLAGERPFKEWLWREANRAGVSRAKVLRHLRNGDYSHLTFRRINARVIFVSGPDRDVCQPLPTGRQRIYDFTGVDLSRHPAAIAKKVGCHRTLVYFVRKKLGAGFTPGRMR